MINLRSLIVFSLIAPILVGGCKRDKQATNGERGETPPAILTVLVIDDALDEALEQEWSARGGGEILIENRSTQSLLEQDSLTADILIYPSQLLGELKKRDWIAPVPKEIWNHPEYHSNDLFETIRQREIRWGSAVAALPFGSPPWVLYIRSDLLEKLNRPPPTTWEEYDALAALMAAEKREDESWAGLAEPWGEGWGGIVLIARAAAYAKHPENYSTLFDIDSFEPLIAGPPFRRALEELLAASAYAPADIHAPENRACMTPALAKELFAQGKCGIAWGWPSAAADSPNQNDWPSLEIAELPGSFERYDIHEMAWSNRPDAIEGQVPLVGFAGRLGSVSRGTVNSKQAWQALAWLAGPGAGTAVGSASQQTSLCRFSQAAEVAQWVERGFPAEAAQQYAAVVQTTQSKSISMRLPPLPGIAAYLAALDNAVAKVVAKEQLPQEALDEAAAEWRTITAEYGRDAQRSAYRKCQGLSE